MVKFLERWVHKQEEPVIKLFEKCPACGGQVVITECRCANCQLQMRGEFVAGTFSSLTDEQLTFVRAFLRVRGNLTEMEKVLGVSYPTLRNKLDEINSAFGRLEGVPGEKSERAVSTAAPVSTDEGRQAVLRQVAAGELSAAEALKKLQEM